MTISEVGINDLLEEIKSLKATVEALLNQLRDIKLGNQSDSKEKKGTSSEKGLVVGQLVKVLTKAKYGKHGDLARVTHIGKVFVSIKLETSGRTTTRLPENLRPV